MTYQQVIPIAKSKHSSSGEGTDWWICIRVFRPHPSMNAPQPGLPSCLDHRRASVVGFVVRNTPPLGGGKSPLSGQAHLFAFNAVGEGASAGYALADSRPGDPGSRVAGLGDNILVIATKMACRIGPSD